MYIIFQKVRIKIKYKKRCFPYMKQDNIESEIKERFNELSDIFPDSIETSDFRVSAVLKFFGNIKGKKVLDVGCGKGRFSKIMADKGAITTGIDPSEKMIEDAKKIKNANFILGSATKLNFPDKSFDYVLSVEAVEHIPETEKAVKEMIRVLKDNGKIVIIDKNILSLRVFFKVIPTFNFINKKIQEVRNKWMYPQNFPFKEKWFFSWSIDKMLKKYCTNTEFEYLHDNLSYKGSVSFKHFPFLNLFIIWKGVK